MSTAITESLAPYERVEIWPAGAVLFREGSAPVGVYYIHSGQIALSFSSKPLFFADAGQILGISAVMSDRPHDSTATTRYDCITGFVEKQQFLRLLDEKPMLWLNVLEMISSDISACWSYMRSR